MKKYLNEKSIQMLVLVGIIMILAIIFTMINSSFMSYSNITLFMKQLPLLGMLAIAYVMLLISGNVDLSIGAIAAFAGTLTVWLTTLGLNPVIVLLVGVLSGVMWGAMNGFLISRFLLQPFILTMGTNFFIRGILLFVTKGQPISGVPDWYYALSNTHIVGPIYSNFIIFIIIGLFVSFLLTKTKFGRYTFAIGSNSEAAKLSGIKVDRHIIKVYMIEGAIAAIAGIFLMSLINIGGPNEINGTDLYAMAAAIIGGAQFAGGVGTVGGTVLGVIIIKIIENGLSIVGANSFLQQAVIGFIIVVAIISDSIRSNRKKN